MNKKQFLAALAALPNTYSPVYQYTGGSGLRYQTPTGMGGMTSTPAVWCPLTAVAAEQDAAYKRRCPFGSVGPHSAGMVLGISHSLQNLIVAAADNDPRWWDFPFKRRMRRIFQKQYDWMVECGEVAERLDGAQ